MKNSHKIKIDKKKRYNIISMSSHAYDKIICHKELFLNNIHFRKQIESFKIIREIYTTLPFVENILINHFVINIFFSEEIIHCNIEDFTIENDLLLTKITKINEGKQWKLTWTGKDIEDIETINLSLKRDNNCISLRGKRCNPFLMKNIEVEKLDCPPGTYLNVTLECLDLLKVTKISNYILIENEIVKTNDLQINNSAYVALIEIELGKMNDLQMINSTNSTLLEINIDNNYPIFTSTPVTEISNKTEYEYFFTLDNNAIINIHQIPDWMSYDSNLNKLYGIPTLEGNFDVTIQATRPGFLTLTTEQSFTLIVTNDPPFFTSNPQNYAYVNSEYSYQIETQDYNNDSVQISIETLPSWLLFNSNSNILSGTSPTTEQSYPVKIVASDGILNTEQSFSIITIQNDPNDRKIPEGNHLLHYDDLSSSSFIGNEITVYPVAMKIKFTNPSENWINAAINSETHSICSDDYLELNGSNECNSRKEELIQLYSNSDNLPDDLFSFIFNKSTNSYENEDFFGVENSIHYDKNTNIIHFNGAGPFTAVIIP